MPISERWARRQDRDGDGGTSGSRCGAAVEIKVR